MKRTVMAFGGGLDSTAMLAMSLNRDFAARYLGIDRGALDAALPAVDAVVFSDPGAEFAATYDNVEVARGLCRDAGIRFEVVKREDGQTIVEWLARNGTVPVMAGGRHVCSLRFKGEVMADWAERAYPGDDVEWLVGIEADEGRRVARFQAAPGTQSRFPLVDLGINRAKAVLIVLMLWPTDVQKSSCVFCPFMSEPEILGMVRNNPTEWALVERVERDFEAASPAKHQAWLDAGKPLVGEKRPHAPRGMWRVDSWAEGARLFAKRVGGRQLSAAEWAARAG